MTRFRRQFYKDFVLDHDNLGRAYIYDMRCGYFEDSDGFVRVLCGDSVRACKAKINELLSDPSYFRSAEKRLHYHFDLGEDGSVSWASWWSDNRGLCFTDRTGSGVYYSYLGTTRELVKPEDFSIKGLTPASARSKIRKTTSAYPQIHFI